ncbi:hypothetical protein Taro_035360 [Colocasia esculenta]|uniref:SWIM-type domain-containing protein n=1 Tax=Colocasia esculenta TaxID=4460 RepID=A0A843W6F1_COLES|nr:hypothetical protein [Colocasia esculenta]
MVETICRQIMEMGGRRRIQAANWETTLCPNIEKVLAKIMSNARQNSIIPSDGRLFEVVNGNKTYVVNIPEWTCSCHKWQLLKIPCEHACVAITCTHKALYDHVSPLYTTNTYRAAYATTINPINNNDMPCMNINDIQVKPPITKDFLDGRGRNEYHQEVTLNTYTFAQDASKKAITGGPIENQCYRKTFNHDCHPSEEWDDRDPEQHEMESWKNCHLQGREDCKSFEDVENHPEETIFRLVDMVRWRNGEDTRRIAGEKESGDGALNRKMVGFLLQT